LSLSPAELSFVTIELQQMLRGARLQEIWSPGDKRLVLGLRGRGKSFYLLIVLQKESMRLHLTQRPERSGRPAPAWVMKLRAEIPGTIVEGIESESGGRRVFMHLRRKEDNKVLVVDLFGAGRILLADQALRVTAPVLGRVEAGEELTSRSSATGQDLKSRLPPADPETLAANRAAEALYSEQEGRLRLENLRRRVLALLGRRIKSQEKLLSNLESDSDRAERADELFRQAELIKLNLNSLPARAERLELVAAPAGERVTVELDPRLSVVENMQRLFERAKKLRRARTEIEARLVRERARLAHMVEQRALAAEAQEAPLAQLARRLGLKEEAGPVRHRPARRQPFRHFVSASGREILVGRSAEDNHRLTFQLARGADLWLHARGWPGAHVLVRLEPGQDIDEQTLLDAATLAAVYSGARNPDRLEITYTRAKYCRPVPGEPGRVALTREKTLLVCIEPQRLARLKASAEADQAGQSLTEGNS
jgi:predicted ribosome quality control (RQC) complex YloA/Tae2 family protein